MLRPERGQAARPRIRPRLRRWAADLPEGRAGHVLVTCRVGTSQNWHEVIYFARLLRGVNKIVHLTQGKRSLIGAHQVHRSMKSCPSSGAEG